MDLNDIMRDVDALADVQTPAMLAEVLRETTSPVVSCVKCTVALRRYVSCQIQYHHTRRRHLRDGEPVLSTLVWLSARCAEYRESFYKLPCTCGQRTRYTHEYRR